VSAIAVTDEDCPLTFNVTVFCAGCCSLISHSPFVTNRLSLFMKWLLHEKRAGSVPVEKWL
jgi:hypothetical protein